MLLYVMCTGREPTGEVAAAIAGGAPVPPPRVVSPERGISEALERVILRAVAPSPDVRFATADELLAALQAAGARQTNPEWRPAQRPRKRTVMVAAASAVVAVLGIGVLRSSGGQGPSASPVADAVQPPSIAADPAGAQAGPPATAPLAQAQLPEREPPAPPRVAMAAPPVEPHRAAAPVAVPARVAQTVAASSGGERGEIWALLDSGRLDEAAARIKTLLAQAPDAAWPRFALGALYYQRYWRPAAVKQWRLALAQDPELRHDPQFGAYLCFMLDDAWKAAGATELLTQLGAQAVPLLEQCVASAKTPRLRSLASRALDGLSPADRRIRR
jgi:hypothetical protein